jgi:hypothetical protein
VGHGEVGEGVVEEVGNVGVAGGEVGGGNVDVGMTAFSLSVEVSAIDFTSENKSGALNIFFFFFFRTLVSVSSQAYNSFNTM